MSMPYQADRYKRWVIIRDASVEEIPALGVAQFHYWKPLVSMPIIGRNRNLDEPYWFEVQSLNDSDDPREPEPVGHFGFVNLWPAAQWSGMYPRSLDGYIFICDPITEAEYGTYLAFDTLPKCPFLACDDWSHRNHLEQVRQLFRYATLHPSEH